MRIAVVGGGIAGLSAAWLLARRHEVTLLEAETRLGGHAWTLEVPGPDGPLLVDIGFTVYNEVTYPLLTRLLAHLGVTGEAAPMTFSVTIGDGELAYAGGSFRSVLAQPWNAVRPRYLGMLHDIARFNHLAWRHLRAGEEGAETLREFLARHRFGHGLKEWYLLPLAASIWSAPIARILDFPVRSLLAFLANHGLLRVGRRLRWRTVGGGSRVLVGRLAAGLGSRVRLGATVTGVRRTADGVELRDRAGRVERFAQIVLATHADTSLELLADASPEERATLGAFRYQANRAVLHGDARLMPPRRSAWASWNYAADVPTDPERRVAVTYWMNRLQGLHSERPVLVSLNPLREPAPGLVHAEADFAHPVLDAAALAAQRRLGRIQGAGGLWYAGAWQGWGFHEDGLRSGFAVARALGCLPPWEEAVPDTRGLPGPLAAQPA